MFPAYMHGVLCIVLAQVAFQCMYIHGFFCLSVTVSFPCAVVMPSAESVFSCLCFPSLHTQSEFPVLLVCAKFCLSVSQNLCRQQRLCVSEESFRQKRISAPFVLLIVAAVLMLLGCHLLSVQFSSIQYAARVHGKAPVQHPVCSSMCAASPCLPEDSQCCVCINLSAPFVVLRLAHQSFSLSSSICVPVFHRVTLTV